MRIFILTIFLFFAFYNISCSNLTGSQSKRVNPTPLPSETIPDENVLPVPTPTRPFPSITPIPTPTPEDLSQFTYELKISFNSILPRVKIDNGEYMSLPLSIKISGGKHTIEIFDLAIDCYVGKIYIIDKDMELDFDANKVCNI